MQPPQPPGSPPGHPPAGGPARDRRFAMVVGGTGMLRGVCLELAAWGLDVGVIARDHDRMQTLMDEPGGEGRIFPIRVDYTNQTRLPMGLKAAGMRGEVPLAVLWVRSKEMAALETITKWLSRAGPFGSPCRIVHVTGTGDADDPEGPDRTHEWLREFAAKRPRDLAVRRVRLGWKDAESGPRWLTHEEICAGVLDAIKSGEHVDVGRIGPGGPADLPEPSPEPETQTPDWTGLAPGTLPPRG